MATRECSSRRLRNIVSPSRARPMTPVCTWHWPTRFTTCTNSASRSMNCKSPTNSLPIMVPSTHSWRWPMPSLAIASRACSVLGEQDAAMERFERALTAPDSDRTSVRLAVARLMMKKSETDDARRQIALALMESAKGRTPPPNGNQLLQAADLFLAMHEYQLAETYFQRALAAGGSETSVRLGLANTYLALGDSPRAEGQLNSISQNLTDSEPSYQYLLTRANVFRQQHQNARALTAFAQAAESAGEDPTAERELLRAGGDEGLRINRNVSLLGDFSVAPI